MVGRKKEIRELNDIYNSNKAELVAIYGRRRVGKTYLIDELFKDNISFRHTGLPPISNEEKKSNYKRQLDSFYYSLLKAGYSNAKKPKTWLDAFFQLECYLDTIKSKRKVIFIDELPWMDTAKANFLEAFIDFWNNYCCFHNEIMLIVCGSASSWILDNVIHNVGGLYGRVTHQIQLLPFNLHDSELLLTNNGVNLSRYEITQIYMAVGGIPYYLNYFKPGLSVAQNLDLLFFNKDARLNGEFEQLFSSQFKNYEKYKEIVEKLGDKNIGYTVTELASELKLEKNGNLFNILKALSKSEFIISYVPYKGNRKEIYYKLIDPFCIFYLKQIRGNELHDNYAIENYNGQKFAVWRGLAFETVCFNHLNEIKAKLGISGVSSIGSLWYKSKEEKGAQIDLIIERKDNIVNLCEAKFYSSEFVLNKNYHLDLMQREELIKNKILKKQSIYNVLITTFGLKNGEYSSDFVNVITLDDLFE